MAMGQAGVGNPSSSPVTWPRQSPEPRSPSGCLKAGPWARVTGVGVHAAVWAAWGGLVHALPSALGC